jgi:hypothetical protein
MLQLFYDPSIYKFVSSETQNKNIWMSIQM